MSRIVLAQLFSGDTVEFPVTGRLEVQMVLVGNYMTDEFGLPVPLPRAVNLPIPRLSIYELASCPTRFGFPKYYTLDSQTILL